jgi:hypothetical protein
MPQREFRTFGSSDAVRWIATRTVDVSGAKS